MKRSTDVGLRGLLPFAVVLALIPIVLDSGS
jgi:hypothetical protein